MATNKKTKTSVKKVNNKVNKTKTISTKSKVMVEAGKKAQRTMKRVKLLNIGSNIVALETNKARKAIGQGIIDLANQYV